MKAEIISIGDELLIGQVINSNAAYLGSALSELGIPVQRVVTVGDDAPIIRLAFDQAWKESDVVIVTGGLGPTHDDISKAEVARFFNKPLELNKDVLQAVEARFARFGYKKMPEANVSQAMVPQGFIALPNQVGTAPGLLYQEKGKTFVILPGVPHEMKWLMENGVLEHLRKTYQGKDLSIIKHRTLHTIGIGESLLAEKIGDVKEFLTEDATLAFLPKNWSVRLRITVRGTDFTMVEDHIAKIEQYIRTKVSEYIFGVDNDTLEQVVVKLLIDQSKTISTAESCTGGMLAARLTDIAGSSQAFWGAIVSYDNSVKRSELDIPESILQAHGAVSEQVATLMAENVRKKLGTTFGVGVTGVAGPGGGTEEKPVGTVWIALAEEGKPTEAKRYQFVDDRAINRDRSVNGALEMLRRRLISN